MRKPKLAALSFSVILVGAAPLAGLAQGAAPKFKALHIGTSATVTLQPPEVREVTGTIEGTLTSSKVACTRNIQIYGSYETVGMGGRRNFTAVSDAEGHWSAQLTHVYPVVTERLFTLDFSKKAIGKGMVCGTGPLPVERLQFSTTF